MKAGPGLGRLLAWQSASPRRRCQCSPSASSRAAGELTPSTSSVAACGANEHSRSAEPQLWIGLRAAARPACKHDPHRIGASSQSRVRLSARSDDSLRRPAGLDRETRATREHQWSRSAPPGRVHRPDTMRLSRSGRLDRASAECRSGGLRKPPAAPRRPQNVALGTPAGSRLSLDSGPGFCPEKVRRSRGAGYLRRFLRCNLGTQGARP
jgi:hypothetical protein